MMEMKIHGAHGEDLSSHESLLLSTPPHSPSSLFPISTPSQAREVCIKFTRGVDFNWQAQALLALQEVRRGPGHCWVKGEHGRKVAQGWLWSVTCWTLPLWKEPQGHLGFGGWIWFGGSIIPRHFGFILWTAFSHSPLSPQRARSAGARGKGDPCPLTSVFLHLFLPTGSGSVSNSSLWGRLSPLPTCWACYSLPEGCAAGQEDPRHSGRAWLRCPQSLWASPAHQRGGWGQGLEHPASYCWVGGSFSEGISLLHL